MNSRGRLIDIALSQVGNAESPRGSNRGPSIRKYFAADDYIPGRATDEGYPWCASFVSWCLRVLLSEYSAPWQPPRTARAFGLLDWARRNKLQVDGPGNMPFLGDIVVFSFSHCGICTDILGRGQFACTEGNTDDQGSREGWKVAVRSRGTKDIKGVIRLPVLTLIAIAASRPAGAGGVTGSAPVKPARQVSVLNPRKKGSKA